MTLCSRCGRERYPIYFFPTPTSKRTKRLEDALPVCEECLTPGERFRLIELPKINRQLKREEKIGETILDEEFNYFWVKADAFRCPFHRNPLDCDDFSCEKLDDCIEYLEARRTVLRVMKGEIRVIPTNVKPFGKGSWEVQV